MGTPKSAWCVWSSGIRCDETGEVLVDLLSDQEVLQHREAVWSADTGPFEAQITPTVLVTPLTMGSITNQISEHNHVFNPRVQFVSDWTNRWVPLNPNKNSRRWVPVNPNMDNPNSWLIQSHIWNSHSFLQNANLFNWNSVYLKKKNHSLDQYQFWVNQDPPAPGKFLSVKRAE